MNKLFKAKSYAKINLGLKVLNKRDDGFHNIESVFIEINLHDNITFLKSNIFDLQSNINIPIKNNTVFKAYNLMYKKYAFKQPFNIILDKNIPLCSGLGGGSSNAACIIKMLNQLNNLHLSNKEMLNIALQIGSDVPFFLRGGIQHVLGRGDKIKKYDKAKKIHSLLILLIFPEFQIRTKWAYNNLKKYLEPKIKSPKFPSLNNNADWKLFENDFERVVGFAYPEIMDIKRIMYKNGALYSGLSGSGSTMFGLYNNKELIAKSKNKLSMYKTSIASPV